MNSLSVEIATQNFKLNQNSIFTFLAVSTINCQLYAGFDIQEIPAPVQVFDEKYSFPISFFLQQIPDNYFQWSINDSDLLVIIWCTKNVLKIFLKFVVCLSYILVHRSVVFLFFLSCISRKF